MVLTMQMPIRQAKLSGLTLPGVGEVLSTGALVSGLVGIALGVWFLSRFKAR